MEMVYKNNLTNGFFLEAGAQNCEWSVTLPLEANFGWTGMRKGQKFSIRMLVRVRDICILNTTFFTSNKVK